MKALTRRVLLTCGGAALATTLFKTRASSEELDRLNKRSALVIGNWKYTGKKCGDEYCRLSSPELDISAVSGAFTRMGLDVTTVANLSGRQLGETLSLFVSTSRVTDLAVLYYSGHAVQIGEINYIIPVDMDPSYSTSYGIMQCGVPLIWSGEYASPDAVGVVILDACRQNVFLDRARLGNDEEKLEAGLAQLGQARPYFFVAYAAPANSVAQAGKPHQRSPYTQALLDNLERPDLTIDEIFRRTITGYCDAASPTSQNAKTNICQNPEYYSNIGAEPLYFRGEVNEAGRFDSPIIASINAADMLDPVVKRLLGKAETIFPDFGYLLDFPRGIEKPGTMSPDLDIFQTADRGVPFLVAKTVMSYAPGFADNRSWGLSYPVLDIVVRKIDPRRNITVSKIIVETRNSRIDLTPYVDVLIPDTKIGYLTIVNQSNRPIKKFVISFDLLPVGYRSKDAANSYLKAHTGVFMHRLTAKSIAKSVDIDVTDILRQAAPEYKYYAFASLADDEGKVPKSLKGAPKDFLRWLNRHRQDLIQRNVEPLWIAGRVSSTSETGETLAFDILATLPLVTPYEGNGGISIDTTTSVDIPINGIYNRFERSVSKSLTNKSVFFRDLLMITTAESSYHSIKISLIDENGSTLFETGWIAAHLFVDQAEKIAEKNN